LLRAWTLLKAEAGPEGCAWTEEQIHQAFGVGLVTLSRVRQSFVEHGTLTDRPTIGNCGHRRDRARVRSDVLTLTWLAQAYEPSRAMASPGGAEPSRPPRAVGAVAQAAGDDELDLAVQADVLQRGAGLAGGPDDWLVRATGGWGLVFVTRHQV
jgi:hypothetical protein